MGAGGGMIRDGGGGMPGARPEPTGPRFPGDPRMRGIASGRATGPGLPPWNVGAGRPKPEPPRGRPIGAPPAGQPSGPYQLPGGGMGGMSEVPPGRRGLAELGPRPPQRGRGGGPRKTLPPWAAARPQRRGGY